MHKYFEDRLKRTVLPEIDMFEIVEFRKSVVNVMLKMGADKSDLTLIHDAAIKNSIRNKRKPEELAWAILQ